MTADFVRDVAIHLARRSVRMSRARGVLDGPPDSGLPADDALLTGLPLVGDKKSITACKFQACQCAAASPQSLGPFLSSIPVPNPLLFSCLYREPPPLFILVIQTRGNRPQPRSIHGAETRLACWSDVSCGSVWRGKGRQGQGLFCLQGSDALFRHGRLPPRPPASNPRLCLGLRLP